MTRSTSFVVALVLATGLLLTAVSAYSAERMTYEEYQKKIEALQAREMAAKAALETENAAIADLKAQLADLEGQIAAVWDEIYAFLNTTRDQVADFDKRLDDIEKRLNELGRLSPEQLLEHAAELDTLAARVIAMQAEPIAKLTTQRDRLAQLASRIQSLIASLPKPKHDLYSVIRGDCLWRIAGKKEIYGDPWKWLRIWSYNKTQIKDPDLIYPAQQFTVPRQLSKDEYLVVRGDNLKKIAGRPEVYGDPFQWTKLYQANKSGQFLSEPSSLYPEQILSIPRN
jgi:nucleoid-associated protein YgaU